MNESSLPYYFEGIMPPVAALVAQSQPPAPMLRSRRSFLQASALGAAALALAACIKPPSYQAQAGDDQPQPARSVEPQQLPLADTELFYQIVGQGLPCVVLHGGLGLDHTYFRPWLDPLGDRLQLIYLDQRGNGRSGRPALATITLAQLAQDVDDLRAALGIEKIALLGHSFGGFVALEYALRYPTRVSHLLLLNTAPAFDYSAEIQAAIARRNPPAAVLAAVAAPLPPTDTEFAGLWRTRLPLYFHQYDAQLAEGAFAATIYNTAVAARSQELLAAYNVADRLAAIQASTLALTGDDDFICPPSQAHRLQAGIPTSELAILADCGHFPFIEQPQAFAQAVRGWLDQTGA
jgi:proline iminopeptidase